MTSSYQDILTESKAMMILASMIRGLVLFTFLICMTPFWAGAQQSHWIDITARDLDVTKVVDLSYTKWEDRLTIPNQWEPSVGDNLHFIYRTGTPWIRLQIWNSRSDRDVRRRIYMNSTLVGKVSFWEEGQSKPSQISGPGIPLKDRTVKDRRAIFEITLQPQEKKTVYLQLETTYLVSTKVYVGAPEMVSISDANFNKIIYFYMGGMALLVIFNLIIGYLSEQQEFIVYSGFASAFGWTVLALFGVLDTDLFPNSWIVFANFVNIFTALTLLAAAFFLPRFLNLDLQFPAARFFARFLIATSLLCISTDIFLAEWRSFVYFSYLIDFLLLIALLFYSYFGFYIWRKNRNRFAMLFLLSWLVVFISILIWFAPLYEVLDDNSLAQYSLLFGNLFEMLLLSLGLAQKFRLLENEKKKAIEAAESSEHYQRLVRVLSHDIANIVTSCRYHFENITSQPMPASLQGSVIKIRSNDERLVQILRAVRQEILLRSLRQGYRLESVNLQIACQEALQNCGWDLQEKDMRIEFSIPPELEVWAHKDSLVNQVLCNLVGNSIKFSQSDTTIKISAYAETHEVVLLIEDQGPGLTLEQRERIFKDDIPFSDKGFHNRDGTGLGTTLVAAYMKLFAGRVSVQSRHQSESTESGTQIFLFFPKGKKPALQY